MLKRLELWRDDGIYLIKKQFLDVVDVLDAGLINKIDYWTVHGYLGELVHESENVRGRFRDWIINHPDLVLAQNPGVVIVDNPLMGHEEVIALGNRVLDRMTGDLNQIIGVLPTLGQADVEEIHDLVSDACNILLRLVEEGVDLIDGILDQGSESAASGSSSSSAESGSVSP